MDTATESRAGHAAERPMQRQPTNRAMRQNQLVNQRLAESQAVRAQEQQRENLMEQHLQDSVAMRQQRQQGIDLGGGSEEQQQGLIDQRLHEAHANLLLQRRIENPGGGGATFADDEAGMGKAYSDVTYPGVYYDPETRTMYIKGTVNAQDWYDDFTKIPAWGNTKDAFRYHDAEKAYNDLIRRGMPVNRVVGHSLGGSIALELAKNKDLEYTRTFGAPVLDPQVWRRGLVERYRHPLDPVSMLDRGAKWGPLLAYPHSYGGFLGFDPVKPKTPQRGLDLSHMTLARRQYLYNRNFQ